MFSNNLKIGKLDVLLQGVLFDDDYDDDDAGQQYIIKHLCFYNDNGDYLGGILYENGILLFYLFIFLNRVRPHVVKRIGKKGENNFRTQISLLGLY